MLNPNNLEFTRSSSDVKEAAQTLGRTLLELHARTPGEIDEAFASMRKASVGALLAGGDPFFTTRRRQIVELAAQAAIPAMYANRDYVAAGGLMSYGNDIPDVYRRSALYVGRILKGEKPADLPIDQATKFEFVINLKTAKTLGLSISHTLVAQADEVIE
jgi:putative ABC transport system substrate-binding protein